jgi:hypothetical protein
MMYKKIFCMIGLLSITGIATADDNSYCPSADSLICTPDKAVLGPGGWSTNYYSEKELPTSIPCSAGPLPKNVKFEEVIITTTGGQSYFGSVACSYAYITDQGGLISFNIFNKSFRGNAKGIGANNWTPLTKNKSYCSGDVGSCPFQPLP